METGNIELQRFARKADGYLNALESSPHARSLELHVISALLLGHCKMRGWRPGDVRVVDLMAGSGYLGDHLEKVGFRELWAIEACDEMQKYSARSAGIRRIALQELRDLSGHLKLIEPQIIVSLAGLHHIICHTGKRIDRSQSLVWQYELLHLCLQELPSEGLLVIGDLVEPGASKIEGLHGVDCWDGGVFKSLPIGPRRLSLVLSASRSIREYEKGIQEMVGDRFRQNPALRWFREVVDPGTEVGHDDMALSPQLLSLLVQHHRVGFFDVTCPWIFTSRQEMKFYLAHKFGFLVDRKAEELDYDRILEDAERVCGIQEFEAGQVGMGWNLGVITLAGLKSNFGPEVIAKINLALILVCGLLVGRAATKLVVVDPDSAISMFDSLIFCLAGFCIAGLVEWISTERERRWRNGLLAGLGRLIGRWLRSSPGVMKMWAAF